MNIERLTKLAEWLEGGALHQTIIFDMSKGVSFTEVIPHDPQASIECGTSCCIAGAAVQMFNDLPALFLGQEERGYLSNYGREIEWRVVGQEARELLELSVDQAERLFEPHLHHDHTIYYFNDPAWAARVIRHLIATGNVDWNGTRLAP
jgi:hypothetical protein